MKIVICDDEKNNLNQLKIHIEEYMKNHYMKAEFFTTTNPSEILASEKNKKLSEILENKFDIVIYDGVPVSGLADAIIMADLVDKIVIVSAYKQTKMEQLQNT